MDQPGVRSVSIVVPCFDEEMAIERTYAVLCHVASQLPGLQLQLCLVDDGSRDGTLAVLRRLADHDARVCVVALSRNFGHQAAITAGIDHADRRADAVLVMDADLETPPELLPRMLVELSRGFDVVLGVRACERSVGMLRRLGSRWFYAAFNLISDVPITAGAPDFYLLSARAREALTRMPERSRFLRGMVAWLGFSRAYVTYAPGHRAAGASKYTLRRMVRLASDALFGFSSAPIKLTLLAGCAAVLVGGGLLAASAVQLMFAAFSMPLFVAGLVAFASGLQLLAIASVGGYVLRNLEESRGRPLYLVSQVFGEGHDFRRLEGATVDAKLVGIPAPERAPGERLSSPARRSSKR
ncbi:MAG: hypothetical protein RL385_1631 [Pseudomonadota bacterium]|jgi:dolichol-phosphate mannosyltransferase